MPQHLLKYTTTIRLFVAGVEVEREAVVTYSYFPGQRPSITDDAKPATVEIHKVAVPLAKPVPPFDKPGEHDLMPLMDEVHFTELAAEILELAHDQGA